MAILEIILIAILIIGLVVLARIEAYRQGYAAGELVGAKKMWNSLTEKPEEME